MGLHQRYTRLLKDVSFDFIAGKKDEEEKIRVRLSELFDGMMQSLYKQSGANLNISILESEKAQAFIEAHAGVLDSSFTHVPMSDIMRRRLQQSNYIFSGMKTFHELNEAFPSMLDEKGDRKPFERFLNDVRKIDKTYNQNYLRAEYSFVQSSAQMAGKWEQIMEDGDRYNLQYRTARDSNVRPEHADMHGITLPPSDPFWRRYYPPNGWRCRCTVTQVRKSKFPTTDSAEAMALGDAATGKDTKGIFRFNPGIEQKSVPDYNPYTIRKCHDCDIAKGKLNTAKPFIPENEMCAACKLVHVCYEGKTKHSEYKRTQENSELFDKLSKDKRYKDVEFNPVNGALKATHIGHNEGKDAGFILEKKLVNHLYSCGHSIILADEQKKGKDGNVLTSLDMVLDGVQMDIRSITKNKSHYGNAIKSKNAQILKYNARSDVHKKANTLCLYFDDPTMFTPEKIRKGYDYMKSKTSKDIQLSHIICVINSAKGLEIKNFDFK